jgi:hypothetical protein
MLSVAAAVEVEAAVVMSESLAAGPVRPAFAGVQVFPVVVSGQGLAFLQVQDMAAAPVASSGPVGTMVGAVAM